MTTGKIDEIFHLWQGDNVPGGQVLVRHKGEIIYDKCFGNAILESETRVTDSTVFHVASVSKQVTILSLLLLWHEGRVDIDADLRKYVSDLIAFEEPLTVRNAMNNVSGIRDQWELLLMRDMRLDGVVLQSDLKKVISTQKKLNFAPLTKYLYSNSNFTLCAEIVKRVSGMSLSEFADKRIFRPLGMKNTCIKADYTAVIKGAARSYYDDMAGNFKHAPLNFGVEGATSLNTTAHDFMLLIDEYKSHKLFPKEIFEQMTALPKMLGDAVTTYGGGIMVSEYKGQRLLTHGGVDAGFRADMAIYPDHELEIIIFSNTHNTPPGVASKKIADIVLDLPQDEQFAVSAPAQDIEGVYISQNEPYFTFSVCCRDGKVTANSTELKHIESSAYAMGYGCDKLDLGAEPHFLMGATTDKLRKIYPAEVDGAALGRYFSDELEAFYSIEQQSGKMYLTTFMGSSDLLYDFGGGVYFAGGYKLTFDKNGMNMSGGRVYDMDFKRV